jgi:hypothetical protein
MTWKTFRAKVDKTLSHSQHFHAIIKAYGLDHPVIVKELNLIASGELKSFTTWHCEAAVNEYYDEYKIKFPALSSMFKHCFSNVSITTTPIEQQFSVVNQVAPCNSKGDICNDAIIYFQIINVSR